MNKQKKHLPWDIISTLGLVAIIYGFGILHILTPDKTFSTDENRSLKTFPHFTAESFLNGEFTEDIATYCSDQVPFRDVFVGAKAITEIALGKTENNGVIASENGHVVAKQDYNDYRSARAGLSAVKTFSDALGDIPVAVAIAGRSQDVLSSFMPELYPAEEISENTYEKLLPLFDGLDFIDLKSPLKARADAGEYVYYKTDHHWTTLGAYYAYCTIMESYGIEPYPVEFFVRENAADDFYGTTWSKAGMKWIGPDTIELFRYPGDETMVTEIGNKTIDGFYDISYLDSKSKYSTFLGETFARASIYPRDDSPLVNTAREKLLIIKDSFAHSLTPFLALHFDIEMVDLRHYRFSVTELIEELDIDRVLILYNTDSLLNTSSLTMLTMGLN